MSQTILERNLQVLSRTSPGAARAIAQTSPSTDITFFETQDGVPGATLGPTTLASRRRPLAEATRFADAIDLEETAGAVIIGFGLGYHVDAVARRMRRTGVVYAFEPDLGLLRAVFERIDHTGWMTETNFALFIDETDTASISAGVSGVEGLLAMGVRFFRPASSTARLAERGQIFEQTFAQVFRAVRTTVVTTLVQVEATLRNLLMNLDHYTGAPGVAELEGACAGKPAIVVSAGPSLRRNIHLLENPAVRDRFVIIAVQTVLRPLLERGIRPHFVTALDFHEISQRFYEGLTPADVAGVTLVAEPKANPSILDSFPGALRCPRDDLLDDLLGPELNHEHGKLPTGATVAHLAYYLARHLGCDPVILVGQDLGFTDGQYYASGAAIHQVWSGELNDFRSLEMLEWERIVRGRHRLRRVDGVDGRSLFTDEQMNAYLVQFERDFQSDVGRGCSVIDATEGGVAKRYTTPMALQDALETFDTGPVQVPTTQPGIDQGPPTALRRRLVETRQGTWRVGKVSRQAVGLLERMLDRHSDQDHVNELIARVNALRDEVRTIEPAYGLVQFVNQTGTLRRVKSDRQIMVDDAIEPLERQRRQIERDLRNVSWLADASDTMGSMLEDAIAALDGAPKVTRDPAPEQEEPVEVRSRNVAALIPVDTCCSSLGAPRNLSETFVNGLNPLALTLQRLGRAKRLDTAVLLTDDVERCRALAGSPHGLQLRFISCSSLQDERMKAVGAARHWSSWCWRGGLGGLTCFDELWRPSLMAKAIEDCGMDAALLVGADWALVDPGLTDAIIERYLERPDKHRLTFCQAPPGLAPCLIERSLACNLTQHRDDAGSLATIGGLLGYNPTKPAHDLIARPVCISIDPAIRDLHERCIPDAPNRRQILRNALAGLDPIGADAMAITRSIQAQTPPTPSLLTLELCTGRRVGGGLRDRWIHGAEPAERRPMTLEAAVAILDEIGPRSDDPALTLHGSGDPLVHPQWAEVVAHARSVGFGAVHVRTDLLCDSIDALLEADLDVISVDHMADDPQTYATVAGADRFEILRRNLASLLSGRNAAGGLPRPWIAPRLTRCDATIENIDAFYDRWIMHAGCAVIDPTPRWSSDRIRPLAKPRSAELALHRRSMTILCDGTVPVARNDFPARKLVGSVFESGVRDVWQQLAEVTLHDSIRRAG